MKPILTYMRQLHAYAGNILYVNLLGMVIISLLDGIGMLLLLPLVNLSGMLNLSGGTAMLAHAFAVLKELPKPAALLVLLGAYIVLMAGQTLLQRNLSFRDLRIHTGFINHVRLELYRSLLQANWLFFMKKRKTDLIHAMTEELGRVTNGTALVLQLLASFVFTLIQIGLAFWLSAKVTLFVLVCGSIIAFLSRTYIKRSKKLGSQTTELARSYIGGMTDHFNGMKDIKSNMLEEARYEWLADWCRLIERERLDFFILKSNSQLVYKLSSYLLVAGFLFLSLLLFPAQSGQLLLIVLIFSRLWPRFTGLQSNMEQIAAALPAFTSLTDLQDECRRDGEDQLSAGQGMPSAPLRLERSLEFRNVSFRYRLEEDGFALMDISLHIPARKMTAVVGRSGAGKSTLIDLLMGLLRPEQGEILIDGEKLTVRRLRAWRQTISYVPQDPFLFNGTIRDNLRMMAPEAGEAELWEALRFAASDEFVRRLPEGLDTRIGDRGIRLSGGERQRLVLARAMLRRPSILILDEATSSLDTENESKIQEALDRLRGTMTIIVVAHRLTTIRNADQVIVIDRGKAVQQGAFAELANQQDGLFGKLWSYSTMNPQEAAAP